MSNPNDHVADFLDDFVHHLLSPESANAVRSHCRQCRDCRLALAEARKRLAALQSVPAHEASEQLIQATLGKIDRQERTRRGRRRWLLYGLGAAAASVLLLAGLHLHYLYLAPTPYELTVYGQNQLLAGTAGSLRVRLTDHQNGLALAGVPVEIELKGAGQAARLAGFTTNTEGTGDPRFQLPDWSDGDYELRVVAQPPGGPEVLTQTIKLKRSWKLMLSSDKPVYQPGQEIHVRSLALRRPDLMPVAGGEVTFAVSDPKGNVIFKRKDVTSKYGIASADCPLATEILEGPYTVRCKVGDTESSLAVTVEKYVLPKFKIDVRLDQPFYQPGQKVSGKVHADYFFGKPLAGGDVEIQVTTTDVGPKVIETLTAHTDASGDATFEFVLPAKLVGREQDSGDARIACQVTVSDTAGEKQTRTVSSVVTVNPLRVEVIPEAGSLVQDVSNKVYLSTTGADGRQAARVRLAVSGIDKELVSNDLGVASFEITPHVADMELLIKATDEQGRVGQRDVHLTCGQVSRDFIVRTDKAVYDGGETMHLEALGGGREPVFVDFIKDGQTILTETIDLSDRRGESQLDLPAEVFGTVELCAYRFGDAGLPVRKTRVLYIRQARQLNVKAALDPEYRPHSQAQIKLELTDNQGKPTAGAISLAAVDEAVFSVLDQKSGMEQAFFALEQELLKPIYEIYAWSPQTTARGSAEERNQLEQALFARTAGERSRRNRDALLRQLLPYLENNASILKVLQRPDWEDLISPDWFPKEALPILRDDNSPHTLSTMTFPDKLRQVEATKRTGLAAVKVAWIIFGSILGIAFLAVVLPSRLGKVVFVLRVWDVVVVLLVIGVLSSLLLPATQKVREASNRAKAQNDLKNIGIALTNHQAVNGIIAGQDEEKGAVASVPVREWFPETLLWKPELITDDQGHASLDVDLADSITTWRLTASAVSADGQLGAMQAPLKVFQPFFVDLNLPVALTRNDEVSIPVVIHNHLDRPQTVELTLADDKWFKLLDDAVKRVEVPAGQVLSTSYRLQVTKVGSYQLQVTARGADVTDAIRRPIEVMPDGRRVEQVFNGTLQQPTEMTLAVPEGAVEGSARAVVKIYPSSFSQLVEGLDGIFQRPYGCFEQTSSTTYPNVLALDYLKQTHKNAPAVEAKARQYIQLGYQRLLGFEVPGGGFDWFGRPPANRTLTAYGLMEFQDMARVFDVDPNLIERTRQWLLGQRNADGSWNPANEGLWHEDLTHGRQDSDLARLSTTAYIAWAVFGGQEPSSTGQATLTYLKSHRPETIDDPHILALVCHALLALDRTGGDARPYLDRLDALKQSAEGGKFVWWQQAPDARTTFYGSGQGGSVETTALATLAMLNAGQNPATSRGALAWLVQQKDAHGTWPSTQATVLALKALLAGTGKALGGDRERRIEIALGDSFKREVVIPADQADVMRQIDLSDQLGKGARPLTLTETTGTAAGYQVAFHYNVAGDTAPEASEPLAIELAYDRTELDVGDRVTATATVRNRMTQAAPMVILDLPIPAGFSVRAEDFAGLARSGSIAKFQVNPRSVVVYLRGLEAGKTLSLRYGLEAVMPVKVSVAPARVYEYYDSAKQGLSRPIQLAVRQGK